MKKIGISLIAVVMATGMFAFTSVKNSEKFDSYYWFRTQTDGTVINSTGVPPFQSTDPFSCSSGSSGCSKAYTDKKVVSPGIYGPDGTLEVTHTKN